MTVTQHDTHAKAAFDKAIKDKRLSVSIADDNYVGDYMFMGANGDGIDTFKHIGTRQYLPKPEPFNVQDGEAINHQQRIAYGADNGLTDSGTAVYINEGRAAFHDGHDGKRSPYETPRGMERGWKHRDWMVGYQDAKTGGAPRNPMNDDDYDSNDDQIDDLKEAVHILRDIVKSQDETLKLVATQYVPKGTFNLEAIETALAKNEPNRGTEVERAIEIPVEGQPDHPVRITLTGQLADDPNPLAEALFNGAVADIWYDAEAFDNAAKFVLINKTQRAMSTASQLIPHMARALEAALAYIDHPTGTWTNGKVRATRYEISTAIATAKQDVT